MPGRSAPGSGVGWPLLRAQGAAGLEKNWITTAGAMPSARAKAAPRCGAIGKH